MFTMLPLAVLDTDILESSSDFSVRLGSERISDSLNKWSALLLVCNKVLKTRLYTRDLKISNTDGNFTTYIHSFIHAYIHTRFICILKILKIVSKKDLVRSNIGAAVWICANSFFNLLSGSGIGGPPELERYRKNMNAIIYFCLSINVRTTFV